MATAIPDLWPSDIDVQVVPPLDILKAQEATLAQKTKGILQAKVSTTATDKLVQHDLDLIAPSLHFYRERILSVTHDRGFIYPVRVSSGVFDPNTSMRLSQLQQALLADPGRNQRIAATEEEFINLVRQVLQSDEVRALIQSLIARSNELNRKAAQDMPPSA
ncbi:MAG: hypothetical protein JNM56_18215 [Planctomycetia bacterium]|nr:hypothetical protein [Planctomycetia bacterium]